MKRMVMSGLEKRGGRQSYSVAGLCLGYLTIWRDGAALGYESGEKTVLI